MKIFIVGLFAGLLLVLAAPAAAIEFDDNGDGVFDDQFKVDVDNLVDAAVQLSADVRALLKAADAAAARLAMGCYSTAAVDAALALKVDTTTLTAHTAAADPHTGYMLESNIGTGASNYLQLTASPGTPDGTKYLRDDMTWATPATSGSGDMLKSTYDSDDDGIFALGVLPALLEGYIWQGSASNRPEATGSLDLSDINESVPINDDDGTGSWTYSGNATAARTRNLLDVDSREVAATSVDTSGLILAAGLASDADDDAIEFVINGGGTAITTGQHGHIEIPWDCTINSATIVADQSGSIVVDIWVDIFANFPPTDADSITASAPPTLSTAQSDQDDTLTGWTTSLTKGQWIAYNVDSATTVERVTISLKVDK